MKIKAKERYLQLNKVERVGFWTGTVILLPMIILCLIVIGLIVSCAITYAVLTDNMP